MSWDRDEKEVLSGRTMSLDGHQEEFDREDGREIRLRGSDEMDYQSHLCFVKITLRWSVDLGVE